jgi:multiple sugar transport system substrate-binding protein
MSNNTALIRVFERIHPNITIQPEPIATSDYTTKLSLEATAGTSPDLLWMSNVFVPLFARQHLVLDLQPLLTADRTDGVQDIYPAILNGGRARDESGLYMFPREASAVVLFYNKTMFRAAAIPYPTEDWTYADFLSAARKLTKIGAGGKPVQWGLDLSDYYWWEIVVPWMVGFGGGTITPDGKRATFSAPGSIKGIQALADLFLKDKVVAPPAPSLGGTPLDPFVLGKAAMFPMVRDFVPGFRQVIGKRFDWDAQMMPSFPSGRRVVGMGAAGYAVSATTRHRDAAWTFIKFVASPTGQRLFARTYASVPARMSLANDPSWRKLPGPPFDDNAFVNSLRYGILPPAFSAQASLACGTFSTGEVGTQIATTLSKIVRGMIPVAPALKALDEQINQCIDQNQ